MIQTLMMQFLNPLFFLGSMYRTFTDTFIDVKELKDTLAMPARVKEGTENYTDVKGNIRFENVAFHYLDQTDHIIENLSFEVKENSFVAIMGESGAGKSTILNLMFRLYDPIEGAVFMDDKNVKDLNFEFRKQISFVSQTPYLFNGSIL